MFRLMAALVAGFALLAQAAHAGTRYTDPLGRFTVTVPENWKASTPENLASSKIALLLMHSPGQDQFRLCLVFTGDVPETKSKTQADVNAELDANVNDAFWRLLIGGNSGIKVDIVSSGRREKNGRHVHYAVATSSSSKPGEELTLKSRVEFQATPGSGHLNSCATKLEDYDSAAADFDTILTSYEPSRGLISQAPATGTSVMTLYAAPNFEGAARVFAQNTANLSALGGGGSVASVSVSGGGSWEVCEGANFTGKCRVLSAAETAAPGQILMIGSARRHTPLNALDWARSVAPSGLAEARERLGKQ